jgi:hypothetical protein
MSGGKPISSTTPIASAQSCSTLRVIMIDRNDCIVREWKLGQGITHHLTSPSVGCPELTQGSPPVRYFSGDEGAWLASQSGHAGHGMTWIDGDLPTTR